MRTQGEACRHNRHTSTSLAIEQISQFHPEKGPCQHVHPRSHCDPFTAQRNCLLWSIKSALCGGTPVYRMSPVGGRFRDPTVQTASPPGIHSGPSQERTSTSLLVGKNLFHLDTAFPQQTFPYFLIVKLSLRKPTAQIPPCMELKAEARAVSSLAIRDQTFSPCPLHPLLHQVPHTY